MNYLQKQVKESKFYQTIFFLMNILGDIQLNHDYYYIPYFISKAEDSASPQPDHQGHAFAYTICAHSL